MQPFCNFLTSNVLLQEKLIQIAGSKSYGQVVFLNGGPGSGKSFAVKNFIDSEKFKIIDPDSIKKLYVEKQRLANNPEYANFDWQNPEATDKLHKTLSLKGLTRATLSGILRGGFDNPQYLPNLILDKVIKSTQELDEIVFNLKTFGYKVDSMHLIWVLVNIQQAVKQNQSRDRQVRNDILIKSHEDVANTMLQYLIQRVPLPINGGVYLIPNERENVTYYDIEKGVVKDFKYLVLKYPGQALMSGDELGSILNHLIVGKIPKTELTAKYFT